jgi:metallo-beta-lactamase class B
MKTHLCLAFAASVLILCRAAIAQTPGEIDSHIAVAKTAAGQEFRGTFVNLCLPAGAPAGARGGGGRGTAGAPGTPDRTGWYASPYKVFDNLYWLGTRQHSSWALRTSGGIIVIDTNFSWAIEPEIVEGLNKLGLNPREVKYVIISHAHGDHDQGAALLQSRYGAKVVMGAADWDATLQRPATAAGGVPKRDVSVGLDGMKLTLAARGSSRDSKTTASRRSGTRLEDPKRIGANSGLQNLHQARKREQVE